MPVDVIKVDKSFVLHMATDDNDDAIVRSTIDLGRSLGLRVVAEGVENEVTVQRLRNYGCHDMQGYFLSRPLPADAFDAWMEGHVPRVRRRRRRRQRRRVRPSAPSNDNRPRRLPQIG